MVARLKPGVTPVQAQTEMDVVGKQLEQQYPDENAGYGIYVNPLENHVAGNVRTPLLVLLGAVGFVLLIACVNVAGLFLARAEARSREIMVRSAMGASRGSLIRQLVMEAGVSRGRRRRRRDRRRIRRCSRAPLARPARISRASTKSRSMVRARLRRLASPA